MSITVCSKCFSNRIKPSFSKKNSSTEILTKYPRCCSKCKCTELIEIDDLMYGIIHLLNTNGFKTYFCCEGHFRDYEDGDSHLGYLYMRFDDDISDIITNTLDDFKDMDFRVKIDEVDKTKNNEKSMSFHFYSNGSYYNVFDYSCKKIELYQKLFDNLHIYIKDLSS